MSVHITTKRRIKTMRRQEFEELIAGCMLSDVEIDIMRRIYVKNQSIAFIADSLGYSESGIKYKHKKVIQKIGKIF